MVVQRQAHKWGAPDLRAPLKPACGTIVTANVTVQAGRGARFTRRQKKREFASGAGNYPQAPVRFFPKLLLQCNIKGAPEGAPCATQAASPAASFALSA
jgi:hypothetical protein